MFYKTRTKSKELVIFEFLNNRTDLPSKEKQHYFSLKKGYEGEMLFDHFLEESRCESIILSDLLLEVNNTFFQIDSLVITPIKVFIYEIKNYDGDYYYESNKFIKRPSLEIVNPLSQLSRTESLLRQLFLRLRINLPVESSVVFINPQFTLYQAPMNQPLIFPSQLNQLIENLNSVSSKITNHHRTMADKLISQHIVDSPYSKVPEYCFDDLRKGVACPICNSFSVYIDWYKSNCKQCGWGELVHHTISRSIKEYQILFPEEKITTNAIFDWCGELITKKRIGRVLSRNYKMIGHRRWAYYE